jgi:hypothetical protein
MRQASEYSSEPIEVEFREPRDREEDLFLATELGGHEIIQLCNLLDVSSSFPSVLVPPFCWSHIARVLIDRAAFVIVRVRQSIGSGLQEEIAHIEATGGWRKAVVLVADQARPLPHSVPSERVVSDSASVRERLKRALAGSNPP